MDESEPSIAMGHDGIGTCMAARLKRTCLRQTWRHKKSARIGREPLTGMCNKHKEFSSDPTSLLRGGGSRGHAKEITPLLHCTINLCCTGWGIRRGETTQATPRSLISGVYWMYEQLGGSSYYYELRLHLHVWIDVSVLLVGSTPSGAKFPRGVGSLTLPGCKEQLQSQHRESTSAVSHIWLRDQWSNGSSMD